MQRFKHTTFSIQNGSPQARSKTVPAKSELATFYGIGTEEIRKSIETLDRILDQYDDGSSPVDSKLSDRKFPCGAKVDPAAQILASCMKTAGTLKLRKRAEEELPPPPPELLEPSRSSQPHKAVIPEPQIMDQQRAKCPPLIPKRGPETKLTFSISSDSASSTSSQPSWDETEIRSTPSTAPACLAGAGVGPVAQSQQRNGRAAAPGVAKRHPESGYITPDQQELIDNIFMACGGGLQQHSTATQALRGPTSVVSPGSSSSVGQSSAAYPQPPAEFSDIALRSNGLVESARQLNGSYSDGLVGGVCQTGSLSNGERVSRAPSSSAFPDLHISADEDRVFSRSSNSRLSGEKPAMRMDNSTGRTIASSSASASSLEPYLACVIPPPPTSFGVNIGPSSGSDYLMIDPLSLVVPPPPPADSLTTSHVAPSFGGNFIDARFRSSLSSSSSTAADISPESPTASSKLPPPPTMPKQLRKTSLPQEAMSSSPTVPVGNDMPFHFKSSVPSTAPPDLTRGLPAATACRPFQQSAVRRLCGNAATMGNSDDDGLEFFPPPPPSLVDPPGYCTSDLVASSLPPPPPAGNTMIFDMKPRGPTTLVSDHAQALSGASVGRMCRGLLSPAQKKPSIDETDKPLKHPDIVPTNSNSRTSLNDQIHAGIHLRPTQTGVKIRSASTALDQDQVNDLSSGVNFENTFDSTLNLESVMSGTYQQHFYAGDAHIDVSRLPGYQEVPPNCPVWKKAMIEKKNKQLEEDAMRELLTRKQEAERWRDIPEWKKSLLMEKEKKKQEELAPYQVERQKYNEEIERLQSLPEWKRNLIIKKRGNDI